MEGGPARWQKVSDAVAGFLRADGKLAPIYAAIYMIPGWTHNIINLSDTEDLVTVMTCNEVFDPKKPDTFFEKV